MEAIDNSNSLYVPEDSVMEILVRLPVESLLRFQCVCKSWYDLIKSLNFVTNHFNYASSDDKASRIVVINNNYGEDNSYYTTTVLSNDGFEIYHDIPNSFLLGKNLIGRLALSNSCNGVICVCDYVGAVVERVASWNPAIREVNNLVLDHGITNGCKKELMTIIGFGVNPKSNVYKVVRCRKFKSNLYPKFVIDIFDIGNNDSWRKLDDIDLPIPGNFWYDGASVYADGLCYWPLTFISFDFRFFLSFDFINEVFERISMPPQVTHKSFISMTAFGDSVALVGSSLDHGRNIVWVLNRAGDKKTWCKQFSLTEEFQLYPRFLRTGKVAMLCNQGLNLYDPRSKECKKLMDLYDEYSVKIMNYVEILVSFK